MASDESKPARTRPSEPEASGRTHGPSPEEAGAEIELALADLVADANGEIVFFNDSGFRSLGIRTDRAVIAEGQVGTHVTATGENVSGFSFVRFDHGLTLYFEAGLHLVLTNPTASSI
jgi:hypothetical protein